MVTVPATVTATHAYIETDSERILRLLSDYWSYFSPGAWRSRAYKLYSRTDGRMGWDGKTRLMKTGAVPAGVFRATRQAIKAELGIKFKCVYERPTVKIAPAEDTEKGKYSFQPECVEAMCDVVHKGGGIVLSATGSGKTRIAAKTFARFPKLTCLFLVNRITLLHQSQKELADWLGEQVGIVGDSEMQVCRVTVATVQTLNRHKHEGAFKRWFNKVALVFVDELHKQMAKKNFNLLDRINPIARFGLTATLQMKKKMVRMKAWAFAGPVVYEFPYAEARDRGVLTKARALQLKFPQQDEALDDDHLAEYVTEIVSNPDKLAACKKIVGLLLNAGRCVFVLVSRKAHVKAVDTALQDIPHGVAYGPVKQTERARAMQRFEAGKLDLLIASSVFEDGVNIKRVSAIVDLAEFKSKDTVMQKLGRGVRLHDQKQDLLYIEFGTQTGRYAKAAKSRVRALRAADIPVKVVMVETPLDAVKAVKKYVQS